MDFGELALFFMVHNFADHAFICTKIEINEYGKVHCSDITGFTRVYEFWEIKEIRPIQMLTYQNEGE